MPSNFLQGNSPLTQGSSPLTQGSSFNFPQSNMSTGTPSYGASNYGLNSSYPSNLMVSGSSIMQGTSPLTQPNTFNFAPQQGPQQQVQISGLPPVGTQTSISPSEMGVDQFSPSYVAPQGGAGVGSAYQSPILSTTAVGQQYDNAANQLNELAVTEDPYMSVFEQLMANNAQAEKNQIASATASGANQKNMLTDSRQQYMGQLEKQGVNTGDNRYMRQQHAGVLESARQSYLTKYQQIDSAEKLAIAEANAAKQTGDVKTMTAKLEYIQGLRDAKAKALSEANKFAWEQEKFNRQMEQEDAQFEREMGYKWSNLARLSNKDKDEEEEEEEELTPGIISVSRKNRNKLNRELGGDLETEAILNELRDGVNQGYDISDLLADLSQTSEYQDKLTPKVIKAIKGSITY